MTKTTDGATGVANVRSGTFQRCRNVNWYNKATAAYFEREFNLGNGLQCMFFSFTRQGDAGRAGALLPQTLRTPRLRLF